MSAALIEDNVVLAIADAAQVVQAFGPPQWGIYNQSGQIAIQVASVVSLSFDQDYDVSDYPLEQGGFLAYNKVIRPYSIKLTVATGGNNPITNALSAISAGSISGALSALTGSSARTAFLQQIQQAQASLSPLSVVMPEMTYPNLTVTHFEFDRDADHGATLLKVDIWMESIIFTASTTTSNTAQAQSANATTTGPAQSSVLAAAGSPLANALNSTSGAGSFTDASTGVTYNFGAVQ